MAKKAQPEEILPCPYCGKPAEYRERNHHYEASCPDGDCAAGYMWTNLEKWQKRHIPELKQVYTQFEESLKANQSKMDEMKKKTDTLFHLVENELAGGRYEADIRLSQNHAEAIETVIALAKEYLRG